jgi:hypothetical protein
MAPKVLPFNLPARILFLQRLNAILENHPLTLVSPG